MTHSLQIAAAVVALLLGLGICAAARHGVLRHHLDRRGGVEFGLWGIGFLAGGVVLAVTA